MSRLTRPPVAPASASVAPHNARLVAGRVLLSNDGGRTIFLKPEDYKRYLAGLQDNDPLWDVLRPGGFDRKRMDFDALGAARALGGWGRWRGPSLFVLYLAHGKEVMPLARLRRALEFVFEAPSPALELELVSDAGEGVEGLVDFACAYSQRLGEWSSRPVDVTFQLSKGDLGEEMTDILTSRGVGLRRFVSLAGKPKEIEIFSGRQRVVGLMTEKSSHAGDWVASFLEAGVASVRLEGGFPSFYSSALDAMLQNGPPEEWTKAALSRIFAAEKFGQAIWDEGWDFMSELAVSCDGTVRSSRAGWALGRVETLKFFDIGSLGASAMDALDGDLQPMCFHCAYKPFCRLPPSENLHAQGTIWGRMPDSAGCRREMGRYDVLFERLMDDGKRAKLEKWLEG